MRAALGSRPPISRLRMDRDKLSMRRTWTPSFAPSSGSGANSAATASPPAQAASPALLRALRYERALVYEGLGQHARARAGLGRLYAEDADYEDVSPGA